MAFLPPIRKTEGQRRTTFLLLSKLFAEEGGLNPPMVDEPCMSSYSTLEE